MEFFQSIEYAISKLPFATVSKRVLVQKFSYENEFDLLKRNVTRNRTKQSDKREWGLDTAKLLREKR